MAQLTKEQRRLRIKKRVRKVVKGTTQRPRLAVFRSNKEFYAQLIDDTTGKTIVAASSIKNEEAHKGNKIDQAVTVGKFIAEKASTAGISEVVFDRSGYLYHGRIKSFAESARESGLKF